MLSEEKILVNQDFKDLFKTFKEYKVQAKKTMDREKDRLDVRILEQAETIRE